MKLETLFSGDEIRARIAELTTRLRRDYADSPFSILCIDHGAERFVEALVSELTRHHVEPEVHHVRARRTDGTRLGEVQIEAFDPDAFEDRDVLVVDDVADEGTTLRAVLELLGMVETRSVKTAVLVDKQRSERDGLRLDYVGFQVAGGWVVGFGMDLDGEYRDLDAIAVASDARF